MSRSIIQILGLDEDELTWQDLSLCARMNTELFYDQYESSNSVARMVDDICLSCPVMEQCLQYGTENSEWGTWGGIYLTNGKPDNGRNSHKSEDTWEKIKERLS